MSCAASSRRSPTRWNRSKATCTCSTVASAADASPPPSSRSSWLSPAYRRQSSSVTATRRTWSTGARLQGGQLEARSLARRRHRRPRERGRRGNPRRVSARRPLHTSRTAAQNVPGGVTSSTDPGFARLRIDARRVRMRSHRTPGPVSGETWPGSRRPGHDVRPRVRRRHGTLLQDQGCPIAG